MSPELEELNRLNAQSSSWSDFFLGVRRMFTSFPYRNMTYLISILAVLGSALWVSDGIFYFLAVTRPELFRPGDKLLVGGLLGFIGCTISVAGSVINWLECVNAPRGQCFGWSIRQSHDTKTGRPSLRLVPEGCKHRDTAGGLKNSKSTSTLDLPTAELKPCPQPADTMVYFLSTKDKHGYMQTDIYRPWCWMPSYRDFRTHYCQDIGFVACCIQLFSSFLFYLGAFTRLPGVYDRLSPIAAIALFWTPKLLGASGFIVASWLFMLEAQRSSLKPTGRLGSVLFSVNWHVGAWTVLGAFGFILGPCMSLSNSEWAQVQSSLATIWAGCSFLVASVASWYLSLRPYVLAVRDVELNLG